MNLKELQASPSEFRSMLLVDCDDGPRPFREIINDWQRTDFEALDNG